MTMIGEDSNAVPTGGLPEIIRISPLARSRISARIRYRRGQLAVSKWRNNGSLPSGVRTSESAIVLAFTPTNSSGKLAPPTGTSYRFG